MNSDAEDTKVEDGVKALESIPGENVIVKKINPTKKKKKRGDPRNSLQSQKVKKYRN